MSTTSHQAPSGSISLILVAIGVLASIAAFCVPFFTPEWYAYLNWKPGIASLLASRASLIAALLTTIVLLRGCIQQEPAYILLVLACAVGWAHAPSIAQHVGYTTGLAKVDCWAPESRQCLVGKFERIEKLKDHKVPVILTEKEQAVFASFKATRDKFEASKPSWYSDEFKPWAQNYRAELNNVFAGYPTASPQ